MSSNGGISQIPSISANWSSLFMVSIFSIPLLYIKRLLTLLTLMHLVSTLVNLTIGSMELVLVKPPLTMREMLECKKITQKFYQ